MSRAAFPGPAAGTTIGMQTVCVVVLGFGNAADTVHVGGDCTSVRSTRTAAEGGLSMPEVFEALASYQSVVLLTGRLESRNSVARTSAAFSF